MERDFTLQLRNTGDVTTWQISRPFHWGLLLFMDQKAPVVPEVPDDIVSQSASGVAVKVRHAQDVELSAFEADDVIPPAHVHVDVRIDEGPPAAAVFSGLIDVPSGVLTVGDVDHDDVLDVGPGRWAVQVECLPRDDAERVTIWLQAVQARDVRPPR